MNLKELEQFKLSNAIQFHDQLNPAIFRDEHMIPAVRDRLLEIADDFMEHLGVSNIDVKDITLSGSNASYTYTPHSDIDLHILVDIKKLKNDEIYSELFHSKKIIWNLQHDITIGGYEVELYVQDTADPVVSRGEYSVLKDRWIKFPTKRVADINEPASQLKFEKLAQVAELALQARDIDKIEDLLDTIRKYRKAGLDAQGEFSPENIAFKAFRTSGLLHRLRDTYNEIHSEKMSMEQKVGKNVEQPVYTISELAKMHGCSRNDIISELKRGIKFEMANTSVRSLATEMAYKNLAKNRKHYSKLRDDYDPNGNPPGPEFKPTMPKGTVRVDVSDVYDWYKLGQHISNLKGLGKHDFGKGPPSTILTFGDEDTEHKYIDDLEATGLSTTDIDPLDPNQPKGMKRQKVDPTFNVNEASGYIPSEAEKNDPRFKTALTVDIKPDSIRQNAIKLGLGKIKRSGIPPIAKPSGKF
jgi:hypothetical protein